MSAITLDNDPQRSVAPSPDYRWDVEVFFDGNCPLCLREINMLKRMDRRDRIRFTDIAAADFSGSVDGRDHGTLMAEIHGRLPDGSWVTGVEVFRHLYTAVGFGWLVRITRLPGISHALELGYRWFAKKRLQWAVRRNERCPDGSCGVTLAADDRS